MLYVLHDAVLRMATNMFSPGTDRPKEGEPSPAAFLNAMEVESNSHDGTLSLSNEQWMRAGTFRGYVELQVVKHTKSGCMRGLQWRG